MNWLASSETRLDYAFSPLDNFEGSTHRFSLLFRFGVPIPGKAINVPDERKLEALNQQLQTEIDKAKKARIEAEESYKRTRAMEDTLKARLERVKKIISESEGKIELVETAALVDTVKAMEKVHLSMRINFDFGKATIRPEDFGTMNQIGEILNTYPDSKVLISGHTDYIGSHDYNYELSKKRIDSVMSFLTARENINKNRFFNPIGYGKLKPIADNTTEEGRFRNRRVDFLIYTRDREPDLPDASGIKAVQLIDNSTIHIIGNGKLTYEHKFLTDPYRLVIDFPRTLLLTEQRKFDLFRGPVIRARLGFHPDDVYTRAVLDLMEPVQYEIETKDNILIIHLK
jgi:outer membrane protein OmpA-like peptidoglycan-associated protein